MIRILLAISLIPLAIIIEGFRRRVLAHMHNRAGPPLLQPFYDILKLLEKESYERRDIIFDSVPWLALLCSFAMLAIIPFSIVSFDFDFIVLGYLFILLDTFYIFGAVASRSPFGMFASVREILLMLGYEIAFIVVLSLFFMNAGVTSFSDYAAEMAVLDVPLASALLILLCFIILRVTPYDVMAAEPEISAGFFTEYSGKRLAALETAEFIKDFVIYMLLGFLLVGEQWAVLLTPLFLLFYAAMQASSPRYSIFITVRTFLFIALVAFADLFLVI